MILSHPESSHLIEIDDATALIKQITHAKSGQSINISSNIKLQVGGKERRSATGGLEYYDCSELLAIKKISGVNFSYGAQGLEWKIPVLIEGFRAELIYQLNRESAAFSVAINFVGNQNLIIRNVTFFFGFGLAQDKWKINIPGNGIRKNLALDLLTSEIGVSPVGGLRGSSSLIHLESKNNGSLAIWPNNRVEISELLLASESGNNLKLTINSNFGSDLMVVDSNLLEIFKLELGVPTYSSFPEVFQSWMRRDGFVSPNEPPTWIDGAMIYEAQIGFSVFNKVNTYSPYPTVQDLVNDLDRIANFGFKCIQLMPKQPYPSYNIHDYWDIDTSYGDKQEIIDLVTKAHQRGIRVILDILLHGVLDKEIIKIAADGVRSGPFADLVNSETGDSFHSDVKDWNNYLIAWSRHILDFEKYWYEGSPQKSPLIEEHPDWFYRNSDGEVQGVYTKAFDARNIDWQNYFIAACEFLMRELNIDGFRFDAPSYNDFPNWSKWSRGRAGASALGCLGLFDRLRPIMKAIKADSLLYTEPSGHVFRQAMDLNYNYDEQWLVTSLSDESTQSTWGVRCAKEFAEWMQERDNFLPAGSMTAHHIDSHDTFWWPSWGKKWRREQFGINKVELLTLMFGSLPGPFMMFSGGEEGIEDLLPKLARIKSMDTWLRGEITWETGPEIPEGIFGITRTLLGDKLLTLVNYSNQELDVKLPHGYRMLGTELMIGREMKVVNETFKVAPMSGSVIALGAN